MFRSSWHRRELQLLLHRRRLGNAGSSHTDVVTASGTDDDGNPVSGHDDATVTITNVPSSIVVTKTATPTSIQEPGGTATFAVSVKNTSMVDSVTITSLSDDIYGSLDGKGTCDVPQTLAPGATLQLLVLGCGQRQRGQQPYRRRHCLGH